VIVRSVPKRPEFPQVSPKPWGGPSAIIAFDPALFDQAANNGDGDGAPRRCAGNAPALPRNHRATCRGSPKIPFLLGLKGKAGIHVR
jgi:hypothetical protein